MPTLEMELGDERLNGQALRAYDLRQQGMVQLWTAKLAGLKALKPETLIPADLARTKSDIAICEAEIEKIQKEVKLAEQLGSPGLARAELKRPSQKTNKLR